MNDDIAIKVEGVSKSFKLPHEKSDSIKGKLVNIAKQKKGYEIQHALKDISFEVKKGEFFGIVGRNGSGKSTLLKLISGIYTPDKGQIHVNGKLTPFIELGVGFNPELTGRENVFLNGALLGFNRKEMEAMYDEIVSFAELERFMDQKLKNYSSGMQVRLAFSIAIRAQSDILVLDEVLAVGDESFQRKCLDVFEEFKANKKTVILVTHDMSTVKRFCSRAILIHKGALVLDDKPDKVAEGYSKLNQESIDGYSDKKKLEEYKSDLGIVLRDATGKRANRYEYNDRMIVELKWPKHKKVNAVGVAICTSIGETVYATNTFIDTRPVDNSSISCTLELAVGAGKYYIMAGTFFNAPEHQVDFVSRGPSFFVNPEGVIKGEGIVRLIHEWKEV